MLGATTAASPSMGGDRPAKTDGVVVTGRGQIIFVRTQNSFDVFCV